MVETDSTGLIWPMAPVWTWRSGGVWDGEAVTWDDAVGLGGRHRAGVVETDSTGLIWPMAPVWTWR
ncbi:MAG: hypothetical protein LBO20_00195 [Bifidobacteriaceae bacterium]|nr:hypothetical protein [Bifidobacteriaceae bacterium]